MLWFGVAEVKLLIGFVFGLLMMDTLFLARAYLAGVKRTL